MATTIIYETHSTSLDNENGIATGWLPGSLSAQGRKEARELGERHRHDGLAAIFSADLRRAVETADIAFGGLGIPIFRDARLRECSYGDLNGIPVAQLAPLCARHILPPGPPPAQPPFDAYCDGSYGNYCNAGGKWACVKIEQDAWICIQPDSLRFYILDCTECEPHELCVVRTGAILKNCALPCMNPL